MCAILGRLILVLSVVSGTYAYGQALLQSVKPWIGVGIEKGKRGGVLINRVYADTPAHKAGLLADDEVVKVEKANVTSTEEMIATIGKYGVGVTIELEFWRQGKLEKKTLALVARPDAEALLSKLLLDQKAKDFTLANALTNENLSLAGIGGKPVLIMFWATWCPACKASLPDVFAFASAHPEIETLLVSAEEVTKLQEFFKGTIPSARVMVDQGGKMSGEYAISALPTFVVIDANKTVRFAKMGGGLYFTEAVKKAEELAKAKN